MTKKPIYLDYQATTPLDERVLNVMIPYLTDKFGNPHSSTHAYGWEGEAALEIAREQVAEVVSAEPDSIIFTSGATEANNLAIKGAMARLGGTRPHMVTVATEHKCVLEAAYACEQAGFGLTVLLVEKNGLINIDALKEAVTDKTALVSVMAVNNEIGVIQPLAEIGAIAKEKGALFHTDAAQAFGKIPLDVDAMQIDLMSISGHKVYGPKGVGALYVRDKSRLSAQMSGGGQEFGLRSGTQAPALVVGLGKAAEIAHTERAQEESRLAALMDKFLSELQTAIPEIIINGSTRERWVGNLNIAVPSVDGAVLLSNLRELALSSGAACASAVTGPSYVLKSIGLTEKEANASLRIGIGRMTTEEEMQLASEVLIKAVTLMKGATT